MTTVIGEGFLGRLTFGMVSFALPLYALHLGLSLGEIGILVSIRTVIALGLKPVAGWASDRVGVRTVYLAGTFARVLAAAALFADSLLMLIAASAYMVHGLFPILATEYAGLSTAQAGLWPTCSGRPAECSYYSGTHCDRDHRRDLRNRRLR